MASSSGLPLPSFTTVVFGAGALGAAGGVSVVLQEGVHLDLGYRYTHVPDAGAAGSLSLHDVRLGIRLTMM